MWAVVKYVVYAVASSSKISSSSLFLLQLCDEDEMV
jgi:hypothetical protein